LFFQIVSKVDESKKMITLNVSQETRLQAYITSVASSHCFRWWHTTKMLTSVILRTWTGWTPP